MNNKYLKFILISSLIVLIIATGLIKNKEYKESKKININIASTLSSAQNQKIHELINKKYPQYTLNITSFTDLEIYSSYKDLFNIVIGLDETYMKECEEKIEYKDYGKYKIFDKEMAVIVKNKKLKEVNSLKDILKSKYSNQIATTNFKYSSISYSIIDMMYYNENFEENYKNYMLNVGKYASSNDAIINLLNKNIKSMGILPLDLAKEYVKENSNFEILYLDKMPVINRTCALVKSKQNFNESEEVYNYILENCLNEFNIEFFENKSLINDKTNSVEKRNEIIKKILEI